ncbi:MAG: phytoene desaturase family protein [Chloroflexota bacterium]
MLDLRRVDPTYHLFFDDGQQLELTPDSERTRSQLEAIEPGSYASLLRYLEEGGRRYSLAMEHIVRRNFRSLTEFLNPASILVFLRLHALTGHYRHMQAFFHQPRLKAAFTFQDMYMGLSPFEAPATFSMLQFTELAHGVWFPRGGMYAIIEALLALAQRQGVEFCFNCPVERILIRDGLVRGVQLSDGRCLESETVLANADLPYVYRQLLPADGSAARLERLRYSCSTVNFLWCLDRPFPQLQPHMLFLSDRYRRNFDAILHERTLAAEPSVFVHAPTRLDPALAPPRHDTVIGIVPVGHISHRSNQDWDDLTLRARQAVMARLASLGMTDFEAHLKFEIRFAPPDWLKRFNLVRGATHGLAHTLLQMGYFRPHNRHPRYPNLYFAGASTHPGTALPTALVSGRLAAERLLQDLVLRP